MDKSHIIESAWQLSKLSADSDDIEDALVDLLLNIRIASDRAAIDALSIVEKVDKRYEQQKKR